MEELFRLVLAVAAIWLIVRRLKHPGPRGGVSHRIPKDHSPDSMPMLRCARCGVYVPQDEAVNAHGQAFCSREHATPGQRR
ncbi:MAG: PP0621 family protein [Acidiferrobacterales bacterium]